MDNCQNHVDDISAIIKELCFICDVTEYRDRQATKTDISKVRDRLIDIMNNNQKHETEQLAIITAVRTT